jgi:hypothetical protein
MLVVLCILMNSIIFTQIEQSPCYSCTVHYHSLSGIGCLICNSYFQTNGTFMWERNALGEARDTQQPLVVIPYLLVRAC